MHPRLSSARARAHRGAYPRLTPRPAPARAARRQIYTKLLLNPFYAPGSRIESADFDARAKQLARRYLGYKDTA